MTDCEFKKECDEVFRPPGNTCLHACTQEPSECVFQRKFAILVRNKTLRDVLAEQIVVSSGLPVVPTLPIEALITEVE